MNGIPFLYKVIINRMKEEANRENEVEVKRARYVLSYIFRVGRKNVNSTLNEMKKLGIIEYKNCQLLVLK